MQERISCTAYFMIGKYTSTWTIDLRILPMNAATRSLILVTTRPDDKAREILANIKPAMKPGYSRLLITDIVIPLMHAKPYLTTMDLAMAAMFSSKERTEDDWVTLLKSAGFKIKKIWESPAASDAVIEAEPA